MTRRAALPVIGRGFLELKNFRKIVDANSQLKDIELSNYGEVFLNPDLLAMLQYADQKRVCLHIRNGANLNTVSKEVLEGVVRYRLRTLCCSIDGATNSSYTRYRVGGNIDDVIDHIEKINHFKKQYQSDWPRLIWQFIAFGHNQDEIPAARHLAQQLGMEFNLKLSWDEDISPITDKASLVKLIGAASREQYRRINGTDYMQGICHQLWDAPQINWDGKVLGCARNFWGDFGGNAFRDGLIRSHNGEKMVYAREMLLGKQLARNDIPCTTCKLYQNMCQTGEWLKRKPPGSAAYLKTVLRHYLPGSLGRVEFFPGR